MKYWNKARIRRQKERKKAQEQRAFDAGVEAERVKRTATKGNSRKNARLMLDVLGSPVRRRMLARLRAGGAMSVSYLAEPFGIMLPNAMRQVHLLERAGLITTKKRGRIRYCVYNPEAARELSAWLGGRRPFETD